MLSCASICHAQQSIDVIAYFESARAEGRDGIARKTRAVDVRPSKPEVIVTTIKGEGKETQSAPAKPGDMVVRNRCPETGNEEILVAAGNFAKRYEGQSEAPGLTVGCPIVRKACQCALSSYARSMARSHSLHAMGEKMMARPGDVIVQDVGNAKDTYRIQKTAFACTYEVERNRRSEGSLTKPECPLLAQSGHP